MEVDDRIRYELWRLSVWIVKLDDGMNYEWTPHDDAFWLAYETNQSTKWSLKINFEQRSEEGIKHEQNENFDIALQAYLRL